MHNFYPAFCSPSRIFVCKILSFEKITVSVKSRHWKRFSFIDFGQTTAAQISLAKRHAPGGPRRFARLICAAANGPKIDSF